MSSHDASHAAEGLIVGYAGLLGKLGMVTITAYENGLYRVQKGNDTIGEYEDRDMAFDFARQQSGFGG